MKPDSRQIRWDRVQDTKEKALALMAHSHLANAPGTPAWKPGAPANEMWIGDQTLSTLFRIILKENHEAALIPFADGFPSGVMRMDFRKNGDLYVGQTGRGWRAKGGSEYALVVIKRTDAPLPSSLQDITRKETNLPSTSPSLSKKRPTPEQVTLNSWTYLDSPNYGSNENDKAEHPIQSLDLGTDRKTLVLTTKNLPDDQKNRVYRFQSDVLPFTKKNTFEAFYSIVNE